MNREITEIAVGASVLQGLHGNGPRAAPIRKLLALASAGKIKLVARFEIADDVPDLRLADFPITVVSSNPVELGIDIGRADPSVLRELTLGDEEFEARFANIQMLAAMKLPTTGESQRDWRDWDHLHFHLVNGRRHFVTLDGKILSVAFDLGERFGATVVTPEEAVARLA